MKPRIAAWLLLPGLLVPAGRIRAEVAAALDEHGTYQCMSYRYSVSGGSARIWSATTVPSTRRPLNTSGDALGDLAPTVVESMTVPRWPLAVWPRLSGGDYDLVFSRWEGTQWRTIQFVQPDTPYNELEPRLAFNSLGQVYLVFWSDEAGIGSVYFSIFTTGHWTSPERVSSPGVDSRHVSLQLNGDDVVRVTFETAIGDESRDVHIVQSTSITDDIDPKLQVSASIGP